MFTLFYTNKRLMILAIGLIMVAGTSAFILLPRMEDPLLTPRAATITTVFPGADAERVESLVTEKIEDELKEIEEIKEIRSSSRAGVSFIAIELRDEVNTTKAATIWARIRDKASDASQTFPPGVLRPDFNRLDIRAYALIVALRWELPGEPNYAILRRLLKQLKDRIDGVSGTERSEIFGDPKEEVLVTIQPEAAIAMNLTPSLISRKILASDSKISAGHIRNGSEQVLLEVSGELDTLTRISHIPIQNSAGGNFVELADVAKIEKTVVTPPSAKVLVQDQPAVALGILVRSATRLDLWTADVEPLLQQFKAELPPGVAFEVAFEQNPFVANRMQALFINLLQGAAAVLFTVWVLHGWRCSLIIGFTLPLSCMMVLAAMHWLEIPIHQMSFTGLIIALGLLIDNSIVVVDEIARKLKEGERPIDAVGKSTKFMLLPLFNATLTTVLSFGPIALMPGGAGEFVGSIGVVTILAVVASMILSLTIIAGMAGWGLERQSRQSSLMSWGISIPWLTRIYGGLLELTFKHPLLGVLASLLLPLAGFVAIFQLPEQFFPPADRNQCQIELEMPATSSLAETERVAALIRSELLQDTRVRQVAWFLGESAPVFYYNVIPDRKNAANYGQAIVDCAADANMRQLIRHLQQKLNEQFPQASCLVRQLEQGPPFSAPIEVRIFGPDAVRLRELGEEVRLVLTQTPQVIHVRSEMAETLPKVVFAVDEQQANLAGLDHVSIASELNSSLEGMTGGSILEGTEELPVRVRVAGERRSDLNQIASLDILPALALQGASSLTKASYSGVPLNAISTLRLDAEVAGVNRLNGRRMNEVQAFITAGVLPAEVQKDFKNRLRDSGFKLPAGYTISYGGVEAERDEAVGNLVANTTVLFVIMVATLVLSFGSFRMASIIMIVAGLSIGLGLGSLWLFGLPWGFMGIVGTLGMIGAAVNDSIVVLTVLMELPPSESSNVSVIRQKVVENTRHILSTTLTTVFGFTPLVLGGGEFWPPIASSISGGVGGATFLALFFVPCMYLLMPGRPNAERATANTP